MDRALKRFRTTYLRRPARRGAARRWRLAEETTWRKMKRQAIERAAGL